MTEKDKLKKINKTIDEICAKQERHYDQYALKIQKLNSLRDKTLCKIIFKEKLLNLSEWQFIDYAGYKLQCVTPFADSSLKKLLCLFGDINQNKYINVDIDTGIVFTSDDRYYSLQFTNADIMYRFIKKINVKVNIDEIVKTIATLKKDLTACENLFKMFENDYNMRQVLE